MSKLVCTCLLLGGAAMIAGGSFMPASSSSSNAAEDAVQLRVLAIAAADRGAGIEFCTKAFCGDMRQPGGHPSVMPSPDAISATNNRTLCDLYHTPTARILSEMPKKYVCLSEEYTKSLFHSK